MGIEGLGRVPSQSISQFRHAINTVRLARVSHRPFGSSERTITEFRDWSTRRPRWARPPVGSRTRPAGSRARRGRPPPRGTRSLRPRLCVERPDDSVSHLAWVNGATTAPPGDLGVSALGRSSRERIAEQPGAQHARPKERGRGWRAVAPLTQEPLATSCTRRGGRQARQAVRSRW